MTQPMFEFVTSLWKKDLRDLVSDEDVKVHVCTEKPTPDFLRSEVIAECRRRAERSGFVVDRIVRFEDFTGQNLSAGRVTFLVHQGDDE